MHPLEQHPGLNRTTPQRAVTTTVVIVHGPPCAGKTTYVAQHKQPGDLVIDYDAIALALGAERTHDYPPELHPYVCEARDAVLNRLRRGGIRTAWVITTAVDPAARAAMYLGAQQTGLIATRETCKQRATAAGRPALWHALIDDWFTEHERLRSTDT